MLLAAAAAASTLCACGGTTSSAERDRAAARAVALAYMHAASAADGRRLCAVLSSAAQSAVEIGDTCAHALAGGLAGFNGPAEHFQMSTFKLTLRGSTGEASVEFTNGLRRDLFHVPLIRQGGQWFVASALTWR